MSLGLVGLLRHLTLPPSPSASLQRGSCASGELQPLSSDIREELQRRVLGNDFLLSPVRDVSGSQKNGCQDTLGAVTTS